MDYSSGRPRPWTVTALAVVQAIGLFAGWYFSTRQGRGAWPGLVSCLPVTVWLIFGVVNRQRWAYVVMLSSVLFAFVFVLPVFWYVERKNPVTVSALVAGLVVPLVLLVHPLTRSYLGGPSEQMTRRSLAQQIRFGLVTGLGVVLIALVVGTPILWALGWANGAALLGGAVSLLALGGLLAVLARAYHDKAAV